MDMTRIDSLFRQRLPGHSLPQDIYLSPEMFDFDMAAIFGKSWLNVAMECELPKTGSYISLMVGKWPVLIVRDKHGDIHAFHNSCRHRGSVICQPGSGTSPKLVCPYHRWTYDLDGSLFAATRMPEDFDKSPHGLKPVNLRCVAGAIFICLNEDPPAFEEFATRFAAYAGPLNFKDMKLAGTDLMVEQANWKLVMDNARECYHCPTGHPELATSFPVAFTGLFDTEAEGEATAYEAQMDALGFPHKAQQGDWWQVGRFGLNPGASTISMDGQHMVKKLLVEANGGSVGSLRWALDPHLFAHATADHVFTCSFLPVSASETHAHSRWYVHKDAVEGVDYDLADLKELWIKTNVQDRDLAENNHRGVTSPGYTPGPYSPEAETLALRFADWYCDTARAYIDAHVHG
jgi:glycine betaine catabolism A